MSFPSFYFSFLPRGKSTVVGRRCRIILFFEIRGRGGEGQVVAAALLFLFQEAQFWNQDPPIYKPSNTSCHLFQMKKVTISTFFAFFPFFACGKCQLEESPMGLATERGEERGGRWKEREIFLTSGWEEEEDGNGTFGGKRKTERWAAKGRTRDTDKEEEEEERLSFFFLSFWMLEGIRLFSQGHNVAEKTRQRKEDF